MEQNTTSETKVSVVIPVYNEAATINETIRHIHDIAGAESVEIIVADGEPGFATVAAIEDDSVVRVESSPGRGPQMNSGAVMATGDILLFLHADTRLPDNAFSSIRRTLAGRAVAGAFSLSINSLRTSLALVACVANWRSRLERIPYGDQAQFISVDLFRELGGFAQIPIMEDVELFRRIRKAGLPIAILRGKVKTSPRRWEHEGVLRRTLTNWWLRLRYGLGATPQSLQHSYRPFGGQADDQ